MREKIKVYDNLQALFDDGIIQHSDILVFFGKRGYGKSSLQAVFNVWFMQPRNARSDLRACAALCEQLNMTGLNLQPPDDHLVFVDTYCVSRGPGLRRRKAYIFDTLEFGLPNSIHPTCLLVPYGKYSFDEGQKTFDSHMGNLAIFLSCAMELSRQPELFIMIAMQRPKRLPLDLRELATFIEPINRKNFYNKYGKLIRTEWTCLVFYKNAKLENYLNSADESLADAKIIIAFKGNIYKCYNSRYFLPQFYAIKGTKVKETNFMLEKCVDVDFSSQYFEQFHRRHTIDIPETFRGKKSKEDK